jgi:hypothetical protein
MKRDLSLRLVGTTCAALSVVLMAGCATKPVEQIGFAPSQATSFSSRTLQSVTQAPPPLTPMRASSAAFGAIGGLAMASAAKTYATEHGVIDPAGRIEDKLTVLLQEKYAMQATTDRLDMTTAKAGTPYPTDPTKLFVDAKTYYWTQVYFSGNWGRFKVYYNTLIQVIDGGTGKTIAQYDCKKVSHDKADDAPTLAELEAPDGPKSTNALLTKMADECIYEFQTTVLQIN